MAIIPNTPYATMTLAQLQAELAIWDRHVNAAWMDSVPEAKTCRDRCAYWVARREAEASQARGAAA